MLVACAPDHDAGTLTVPFADPDGGSHLSTGPVYTDYYEADWDDGVATGHTVALPTVVVSGTPASPTTHATVVGDVLADEIDDYANGLILDGPRTFIATLRDSDYMEGKVPQEVVDKGWIDGTITNDTQDDAAYAAAVPAWLTAIDDTRLDAYAGLGSTPYSVVYEGEMLPFVRLEADLSDLAAIVAADVFASMSYDGVWELDTDGSQIRTAVQMDLDRTLDYDGVQSFDGSTFVGQVVMHENFPPDWNHPVFDDGFGTSRIRLYSTCSATGCSNVPSPAGHPTNDHGNQVLSTLMGDLTAGQDPAFIGLDTVAQRRRSAGAHGVEAYLSRGDVLAAMDYHLFLHRFAVRADRPQVINYSGDVFRTGGVSSCIWNDLGRTADQLTDQGIAVFVAAGNPGSGGTINGDDNTKTCEMRLISSGTGTFVVQGHDDGRGIRLGRRSGVRSNRSRVDMTVYDTHDFSLTRAGGSSPGFGNFFGTSASTPFMASAAITFQDFYMSERSRLAGDPGILFANLYLMGDRWGTDTCAGTYCTGPDEGFDSTLGAGRFRMRTFSSKASPKDLNNGGWISGRLCVGNGDVKETEITQPSSWPAQAKIDAVARWTDDEYDTNEIGFRLLEDTDGVITELSKDATINEVKRRVGALVTAPVGSTKYIMEFSGTSVTHDSPGCNGAGQRVHFAAVVEAP